MTEQAEDLITFECLLASSEIPSLAEVPLPTMLSYKFDGMRTEIVQGRPMSRKMIIHPNLFLQKWIKYNEAYLNGFDCEIIVGEPNLPTTFHTTQSGIRSEEGRPDFKLYVLDHWDMEGETAQARYEHLQSLFENLPPEVAERCVLVEQHLARLPQDIKQFYDKAIALGYEGIMCKAPDKHYKYGRSTLKEGILLKWKDFADSEIRIETVIQGMKNGNEQKRDELGKAKRSSAKAGQVPQDIIGGFIGPDVNPHSPFFGKKIKVGPGAFTKDMLKSLWKKHQAWEAGGRKGPSPVVNRLLTYKYQVAGVKDLPRYPGAKGFRSEADL